MKWFATHFQRGLGIMVGLVFGLLVGGCEPYANKPEVFDPKPLDLGPDILRVGDRIRIIYLDIPDAPPTPTEQQIPESGKLLLPKGIEVVFANRMKTDVEKDIQDLYVRKHQIYPRMTVNIERQNLVVSVGGEVRTPSFIVHSGQMTLTKAINAAGGFTEFANKDKVVVTRASTKQQLIVNVKKALNDPKMDVPIYPGDLITVNRRIW